MSRCSNFSAESIIMSLSIRSLGVFDRIVRPSLGYGLSSDGGGGYDCIIAFAKCPDPEPKSTTVLNRRLINYHQFVSLYL